MTLLIRTKQIAMKPFRTSFWGRKLLSNLCFLALVSALGIAHASVIESGHSALWFDPDRTGEGWVLEMLSEDHALVYWYTYDDQGNQRWLQGIGAVASDEQGEYLDFSELYITRGGRFGPDFNPDDVEIEVVGEAVMRFADCDRGSFSYSAFDQSQTIEIQRLTKTMAAGCAPIHGVPGEPISDYAGQSGTWFDPARDGEGFSMHWLSRDEALVTWYTYDDEGNQRWMVGNGLFVDGKIEFSMIHTTQGGRFGTNFDPNDVELVEWGSLTMELACLEGAVEFDSVLPEFGSGGMDLSRLTILDRPGCPWTKPKLTDLYDITWKELPIAEDELISAVSIADDGTVAGIRRSDTPTGAPRNLVLLHPNAQNWETIPGEIDGWVEISADASMVLGRIRDGLEVTPILWNEETGWVPLTGLIFSESFPSGVSRDFSHIVGLGSNRDGSVGYPWIWDAENGQRQLPVNDETPVGAARAVSNDGSSAVGDMQVLHLGGHGVGVLWSDWDDPLRLLTPEDEPMGAALLCNHDCSIVVGHGLAGMWNPQNQAWYRTTTGKVGYLGEIAEAAPIVKAYIPNATISDGGMIFGHYYIFSESGSLTRIAFLWTQMTGIVSARTLIADADIGDQQWSRMSAISSSTNGDRVLITGAYPSDGTSTPRNRSAVLLMSEKY